VAAREQLGAGPFECGCDCPLVFATHAHRTIVSRYQEPATGLGTSGIALSQWPRFGGIAADFPLGFVRTEIDRGKREAEPD